MPPPIINNATTIQQPTKRREEKREKNIQTKRSRINCALTASKWVTQSALPFSSEGVGRHITTPTIMMPEERSHHSIPNKTNAHPLAGREGKYTLFWIGRVQTLR